jgi:hypothetical protein
MLLLFASVAATRSASALPVLAQVAPPTTHRVVRLDVLGSREEAAQLRATLVEQFGRIRVELAPLPGESENGALLPVERAAIAAEVDLRDPTVARVRLTVIGGPPGEPRLVALRESRAVLLEEVALVVYAGSESLLDEVATQGAQSPATDRAEEGTPATSPPPAAPVIPAAPPAAEKPRVRHEQPPASLPWVVEGSILVGARAYERDALAVWGLSLGARAGIGHGRWVPGAWLLGEFHFPFSATSGAVELTTSVWSVRLEPSIDLVQNGLFRLELGAGGGADVFVIAPVSSAPEVELGGHRQDVSAVLATMLAASLATTSGSRFVLAATLDYDLAPRRYLVVHGEQSTPILQPWRFRPAISVGFLFEMARGGGHP